MHFFLGALRFKKNIFRNTIRVSTILDLDQTGRFICPDLGPNCLQQFCLIQLLDNFICFPGQFGAFQFSFSALVGCLLATILSILDSVGDYFACAKACSVPPPPRHAVNRGLTIEGLCTFLAGCVGCGHATTTYAGNIGAIGLTKVCREEKNNFRGRPPDKSVYWKIIFFISHPKHMLWVLTRTVSMRRFL